jgi:hypothetical protein
MPRRSEPKNTTAKDTPLDKKKSALSAEAEQLKAKLQQARRFLQEAPTIKAEAQRKEQQELLNRYRRPTRVEGPSDFRLELVNSRPAGRPRTLRRERSLAPMLTTVFLLVACAVVLYYAVRVLQHG